jgi:hypothetical protein
LVVTEDALAAAVLCEKFKIPEAATCDAMCDALIVEALRMPPGTMTLSRIRAHVLAQRAGIDVLGADAKGAPTDVAARFAATSIGARSSEQAPIAKALGRRWVSEDRRETEREPEPLVVIHAEVTPQQPLPAPAPTLLDVVREAIPRVGADGRFGSENVYVSAIWRSIARDRRMVDLSLERFKRWLVTANRDGWLVLARADLIGAMDSKQVAESEIEDRGATFHFVLDQGSTAPVSDGGNHAR